MRIPFSHHWKWRIFNYSDDENINVQERQDAFAIHGNILIYSSFSYRLFHVAVSDYLFATNSPITSLILP